SLKKVSESFSGFQEALCDTAQRDGSPCFRVCYYGLRFCPQSSMPHHTHFGHHHFLSSSISQEIICDQKLDSRGYHALDPASLPFVPSVAISQNPNYVP